jgi:hypothetical protein
LCGTNADAEQSGRVAGGTGQRGIGFSCHGGSDFYRYYHFLRLIVVLAYLMFL